MHQRKQTSVLAHGGVPMTALELVTERSGHEAVVQASGEIDLTSVDTLESSAGSLISEGVREFALDLSAVSFVDSTGLKVLVRIHDLLKREGGRLVLRRPSRAVGRLLEVSGLDGHLVIEA